MRILRLVAATLLAFSLAGCVPASDPVATPIEADAPISGEASVASPTPSLPNAEGSWADCPDQFDKAGCVLESGECQPWIFAGDDDPEQLRGWKLQIPVDGGPREFAMGDAVLDSAGVPVAYAVASGDIIDYVLDRFCLNTQYLYAMNQVRRDQPANLFEGDTLNLDAHAILTVGDQNGVVYDNAPPTVLPPQR